MTARIVIIDDEKDLLELLSSLLQEEGYEVHLRNLIFEDLADLKHLTPNLIILDLFMGHQAEGWKFLQRLKTHQATATIPLILCTAAHLTPDQQSYTQQQRIPIVSKPFDLDDLVQLVRKVLVSSPPEDVPLQIV